MCSSSPRCGSLSVSSSWLTSVLSCGPSSIVRLRVAPMSRSYNRPDMERTFAIIKPDAVAARLYRPDHSAHRGGGIPDSCHAAACTCRSAEAEGFYAVHRERPFFASLTKFMSSGPVVVLALEAPDAIKKWRTLMGATDPGEGGRRHAAQGVRRVDREQRDARIGRAGDGGVRAGLLLSRDRADPVAR